MCKIIQIFILWILLPFSPLAQPIDTIINKIRFSIEENNDSKLISYLVKIENNSAIPFRTSAFGVDVNKIEIYNSKNEHIGYNFIHCLDEQIIIEPDSSKSSIFYPYIKIPKINRFVSRQNKVLEFDSLHHIYWFVNNIKIGPIHYYIEKDLVNNLSAKNTESRDIAATVLRKLFKKQLNIIKEGHAIDHDFYYWNNKLKSSPKPHTKENLEEIFNLKSKRFSALDECVTYNLDHTYLLIVKSNFLSSTISSVELKKEIDFAYLEPDLPYFGIWKNYYYNGNLISEKAYAGNNRDGVTKYFYPTGKLRITKTYKHGRLVSQNNFNEEGKLISESKVINENGDNEVIKYDLEGKIISSEINKEVKLKRKN